MSMLRWGSGMFLAAWFLCGAAQAGWLGTTAAPFLKIGVGARANAMGEAYTAAAEDATALYWNPAGLASMSKKEIVLQHNIFGDGVYHEYLAYGQPLPPWGSIGLGVTTFWITPFEVNDDTGADTGVSITVYDLAVSAGWAAQVLEGLQAGTALKLIQRKIDRYQCAGLALDGGVLYRVPFLTDLQAGLAFQNLGPALKFNQTEEPLPFGLRGGLSARLLRDDRREHEVSTGLDVVLPSDGPLYANAGAEYVFVTVLSLRAGYLGRPDAPSAMFGFGLKEITELANGEFDYAYAQQAVSAGGLGPAHRVSLRYTF